MARISETEMLTRIMNGLKCSEDEAREILAYDKAVEHDEKTPYDLTPEQMRIARQAARVSRKPTIYKLNKRTRKPNATKGTIIAAVAEWLNATEIFSAENIEITNKERQIKFSSAGEVFELTLVQKRKPKE